MDNTADVRKYLKELEVIKKLEVVVGLPKGKADGTVISYGTIHEFGEPKLNIPRRSFLRTPVLNAEHTIIRFMDGLNAKLGASETAKGLLAKVGVFVQGISVASFRSNNWQKNSDRTIARKGSSTPLIDTGHLRQSITHEVRNAS